MITKIKAMIDRLVELPILTKVEKDLLARYESLTPMVKEEKEEGKKDTPVISV